jgi:predicted permease
LIILTYATLLFEIASAREAGRMPGAQMQSLRTTVLKAAKAAVLHPVSLPAFLGLMFSLTGLELPELIDKPLDWLGRSFSPLALIMVGIQLQQVLGRGKLGQTKADGSEPTVIWREVFQMVALKNVFHPLLILTGGYLLGLPPLPMTVMMLTACMPVGANSYLFASRYKVREAEVSVSLSLSVVFALVSVPTMLALQHFVTG